MPSKKSKLKNKPRYIFFRVSSLIILLWVVLMSSCRQDLDIETSPELQLEFSQDTILFDTLLTSRTSITKRLRIRNVNKNAIKIDEIRVASDESAFSIIANGKKGNVLENEIIAGEDSLLILVEVTIDPRDENLPFLVKDSLMIMWNQNTTDVKLISWGQDAEYIGNQLICNETWTNERPYVLFDNVLVDSLCTLTVEPGTKIYADVGVGLYVQGKMTVKGDSGNRVIFRNSRFDASYLEAPGQWDGIFLLEGSTDNQFDFTIVENSRYGFRVGTPDSDTIPDLVLRNSIVRFTSENSILAFTSDIYAENSLFYNAGGPLLFNVAGGTYNYEHCTFSNSPNFFFVDDPAVVFADNIQLDGADQLLSGLFVSVTNSIIYGSNEEELIFSITEEVPYEVVVTNNLISGNTSFPGNVNSLETNFPGFVDPFAFNFELDSTSIAIDQGDSNLEFDLNGKERDSRPDIGALEFQKKL